MLRIKIERLNVQHVLDVARVLLLGHRRAVLAELLVSIVVTLDRVLLHRHAPHHGQLLPTLDTCINTHSIAFFEMILGRGSARTHFTLSIAQVMRHRLQRRGQLHQSVLLLQDYLLALLIRRAQRQGLDQRVLLRVDQISCA